MSLRQPNDQLFSEDLSLCPTTISIHYYSNVIRYFISFNMVLSILYFFACMLGLQFPLSKSLLRGGFISIKTPLLKFKFLYVLHISGKYATINSTQPSFLSYTYYSFKSIFTVFSGWLCKLNILIKTFVVPKLFLPCLKESLLCFVLTNYKLNLRYIFFLFSQKLCQFLNI